MKVFRNIGNDLTCDECGRKLKYSTVVLIGEFSHDFAEDTREVALCPQCIYSAVQKIYDLD